VEKVAPNLQKRPLSYRYAARDEDAMNQMMWAHPPDPHMVAEKFVSDVYHYMRPGRDVLYAHPDAIKKLVERFRMEGGFESFEESFGIAVRENENLSPTKRVWVFPDDPYFKYEKSDEPWCRYFGIGHEEERLNYFLVSRAAFETAKFSFAIEEPRP
jgi:hypothetical protein